MAPRAQRDRRPGVAAGGPGGPPRGRRRRLPPGELPRRLHGRLGLGVGLQPVLGRGRAKLHNATGIANGRITGNGHTWNAVKIDGKWCQMDLTWDDTSENWYGDPDQGFAQSPSPLALLATKSEKR